MNVIELFLANARRFPDKTFLVDGTIRLGYREMARRVVAAASGLRRLGARPGDVVGLLSRNRHEWVELYLGASLAGAVVCLINFRLVGKELSHVVNHSGGKWLVYDGHAIGEVTRSVVGQAAVLTGGICLDEPCPGLESVAYTDLLAAAAGRPETEPWPDLQPGDLHNIMFTSGTTGLPKGVKITHANTLMSQFANCLEWGLNADDRILLTTPLCHRTGFTRFLNAATVGASVVMMREFKAEAAMELIDQERITAIGIVPTMMRMILRVASPKRWDGSSVRTIVLTGEACPPSLKQAMLEVFPRGRIFTFLASTEAGMITSLRPEDQIRKSMSVGKPMPGLHVAVVDEAGRPLNPGQVGEIWVQSRPSSDFTVIKGYLRNREADAAAFAANWFKTGDCGQFDEDGYLYVTDRKTDMILSGGLNIYSKEVENTISEYRGVLEVAVVGVPDADWGEAVLAYVVPEAGVHLSAEAIIAFCKERLASYKKPRYVRFLPELPKNALGKVLKFELRELAGQALPRA